MQTIVSCSKSKTNKAKQFIPKLGKRQTIIKKLSSKELSSAVRICSALRFKRYNFRDPAFKPESKEYRFKTLHSACNKSVVKREISSHLKVRLKQQMKFIPKKEIAHFIPDIQTNTYGILNNYCQVLLKGEGDKLTNRLSAQTQFYIHFTAFNSDYDKFIIKTTNHKLTKVTDIIEYTVNTKNSVKSKEYLGMISNIKQFKLCPNGNTQTYQQELLKKLPAS